MNWHRLHFFLVCFHNVISRVYVNVNFLNFAKKKEKRKKLLLEVVFAIKKKS